MYAIRSYYEYATVDEVREGLKNIRVVPVPEPALNGPPPLHWTVIDKNGEAIVVEYIKGELTIFDNPLRVMTNSPNFDWHMTNLRNYRITSYNVCYTKLLRVID